MTTTNITNVTEASWSENNPNELDYLRPNAFKFQVHNIPNVSYFCQAANIPEMNLPPAIQTTPLVDIPYAGDKLDFGVLMIRFLIQEDMKNYKELYDWMIGLGFPVDHKQFIAFGKSQEYRFPDIRRADFTSSDASLFLLDSNNNPITQIVFRDAFPVSLQGLDFEISSGQTDYMVGVAMFRYKDYIIETTTVPISFVPTNVGPTITSSGYFWAAENQMVIGTIVATDPENNTLTYSIAGDDASTMSIVSTTGVLTFNGPVASATVTSGGTGYTSVPTVTFSGGGGTGAAGTAVISSNALQTITITNAGSGYTSAPTVAFSGGGGSGAAATAALVGPDYETKASCKTTVSVTDGITTVKQNLIITITDVAE